MKLKQFIVPLVAIFALLLKEIIGVDIPIETQDQLVESLLVLISVVSVAFIGVKQKIKNKHSKENESKE